MHQVLRETALAFSDEDDLAAAFAPALLSIEPDVMLLRRQVGREIRRRLATALGDPPDPHVLNGLEMACGGSLIQIATGLSVTRATDRLNHLVELIAR